MPRTKLREKFSVDKDGDTLFVADKRDWPESYSEELVRVYVVEQDAESSASKLCGDTDYDKLLKYLTTDYCARRSQIRSILVVGSMIGTIAGFVFLALGLTVGDPQLARLCTALCIGISLLSYAISKLLGTRDSRIYRALPPEHVFENRVDRALMHWGGKVVEHGAVASYVHSYLKQSR